MAQRGKFEIPAKLSFRPYCARWTTCSAEVLGWREKPAIPYSEPGLEWLNPLDDEVSILLRLNVLSAQDLALAAAFGLHPSSGRSYTIDILRRFIPPDVLPPYANRQNIPDIGGGRFDVLVCPMKESEEFAGAAKLKQERDAWEMRDEFLHLEQEIPALEQFLERWGLWSRLGVYRAHSLVLESPNLLWARQKEYRRARTGNPHAWLGAMGNFTLSMSNERPYFEIQRSYCEEAIKATITIDHLRNVRTGTCRRHDCRRLFERTSGQKRFYCKPECAHLANVRKLRAQKKKLESKERKHATR
jgi:hypothetical protein